MIKNGRLNCPQCGDHHVTETQVKTSSNDQLQESETKATCQECHAVWTT